MLSRRVRVIVFILMLLLALIWLVPILFVLLSSFRTRMDVTIYPAQLLPHTWTTFNYEEILFNSPYAPVMTWLLNSVIVSTAHTLITLLVATPAAYAFARLQFKFRETLFWILLATMMIPKIVNFVPLYKLMRDFKMLDTLWCLIIPGVENAFNVFLLRQFMRSIPKDIEEAAYIDGSNSFGIFTRLFIPLCKPVILVVGLFAFRNNWNELLWPLVAVSSIEKRTVTAGLSIAQGTFDHEFTMVNTVAALSVIPLVLIFIFTQKYFMQGLNLSSGSKE
ncbi:MAG: carbohydrate ABC transporter permease [Clostridia bacterium]